MAEENEKIEVSKGAALAEQLAYDIKVGNFKPFGDTPDGELATMMKYVDGIDAAVPN